MFYRLTVLCELIWYFRILSLLSNQYLNILKSNRSLNDLTSIFNFIFFLIQNVTFCLLVFLPIPFKVMKILCYSAKLASGLNVEKNPGLAKRLAIISSKISGARATLRLIDDIPMLQHTLEYGLGSKVKRKIIH